MIISDTQVIAIDEIASELKISKSTVYELLHQKRIRHVRVGKRYIVPYRALVDFLNQAYEEV